MWKEGVRSLIYESPERHRKILLKRLFSPNKKTKMLKQSSKLVLNCIWNQILTETNRRKQLLSMQD